MATRGNANINSLLATAKAARDKQLAYNDQAAAFDWNLSAKTQDDLNKYMDYLTKRQGSVTDPSSQLTQQTKMVEARRTYTSAEVGRQTISVLYGEQSNEQKYAKINSLLDQAAATGDASLYQSLDDTRARLSKTIQDEQQAGADRAAAATSKAQTATAAGVQQRIDKTTNLMNLYKGAATKGLISPSEYQDKMAQAAQVKAQAYQSALNGEVGDLSESKLASYKNDYESYVNSSDYLHAQAADNEAVNGGSNKYLHFGNDGLASMENRTNINPLETLNKDGKPSIVNQYLSGYTGSTKGDIKDAQGKQFILNHYLPGDPSQGLDPGKGMTGFDTHTDPNGQSYYMDALTGKRVDIRNGTDAQGNPTTYHQLDTIGGQKTTDVNSQVSAGGKGVFQDIGNFLANRPGDTTFQNDLAATGGILGDAAKTVGGAELGAAKKILAPQLGMLGTGLNAISHLADFGTDQRAKAAAAAAAQQASQLRQIQAANASAAANSAIAAAKSQAAKNALLNQAGPTNVGAVQNFGTPAQKASLTAASGGGAAAVIKSALGNSAWWALK